MSDKLPEVWLRGPVEHIPALLQPVAHALLQAQEELHDLLTDFPEDKLWIKPAGMASAGFHLQHLAGVLDRLLTYAAAHSLNPAQMKELSDENLPFRDDVTTEILLNRFDRQISHTLDFLRQYDVDKLLDFRGVGRKQIPSNALGLLFHAAEHTMRHLGQLIVTVKVVSLPGK